MKSFEFYKQRATDSMKDGLSHEQGSDRFIDLLKQLRLPDKYDKMTAVVKIFNELIPKYLSDEILNQVIKYDRRVGKLPFSLKKFNYGERKGEGGEHKVYFLESKNESSPSYVVKINHRIKGNPEELANKANEFKDEYESMKVLYASMPKLIPDELTMITRNPKNNKPAIATIQKLFGKVKDPVNKLNDNDLMMLFDSNPELQRDFKMFYEITQNEFARNGRALDLIGENNLAIIEGEEGVKLIILDPHNSVLKEDDLDRREKMQAKRMNRLRQIYELAQE